MTKIIPYSKYALLKSTIMIYIAKLYADRMLVAVLSSINDMSVEDRFLNYILNGCRLLVYRIIF